MTEYYVIALNARSDIYFVGFDKRDDSVAGWTPDLARAVVCGHEVARLLCRQLYQLGFDLAEVRCLECE